MKDKVYNIMEDAYNQFKGNKEAQIFASNLISKYFRQFCEWLNNNSPYDYHKSFDIWINFTDSKDRKTFDDLFNYWFNKVREK